MDTAKAGRYLGCYSRELVIMGPCRHFRDWSAASAPQRWGHILKNGLSLGQVPIDVSASEASIARQRSIKHLSEIVFACSSAESDLRKQLVATTIGAE